MVEEFGVSMTTVQRVLDTLVEDGFVHARPGAGTFVAEHPPHLCNYAVVIPSAGRWSRFYTALRKAARVVENGQTIRFREYFCHGDVDSRADMARLGGDIRSHRLAGLILAGPAADFEGTPALDETDIPRVTFHYQSAYGLPSVYSDLEHFLDRAIQYLVARGRRRIAHLWVDFPAYLPSGLEEFEANLRERDDTEFRPYWIQPVPATRSFRAASYVVNLLMQLKGEDRPDALIIHDDNLVEHAVAGLLAAGVKVPQELEVVAQCNYPSLAPSTLPLKRLGFDCRTILEECLRVIDMQHRGRTPPSMTKIPAVFEDEIDAEGIESDGEDL